MIIFLLVASNISDNRRIDSYVIIHGIVIFIDLFRGKHSVRLPYLILSIHGLVGFLI